VAISLSFKKLIQKNDTSIFWALLVLSFDYLLLFFIESILPGYVMNHFNLNFLLLIILFGWIALVSLTNLQKIEEENKRFFRPLLLLGLGLFVISLWFILYNLVYWELVIICIFLAIIGYLFYKKI